MANRLYFNVTGPCIPSAHYMVDTSKKIDHIITEYVDAGAYFIINRARQYGKTTTLELLYKRLLGTSIVFKLSFEGKDEYFASLDTLADGLRDDFHTMLLGQNAELAPLFAEEINERFPLKDLGRRITQLCQQAGRPVVLIIDEVDKACDNQLFLTFLGWLRDQYISKNTQGDPQFTFQSVILAGVHDIKNLRMKIRPEEKHRYNSPWNIATRFDVDMSFSAPEIESMLEEYEAQHQLGIDIAEVSKRLSYYTGGYPFLVSLLCKCIEDDGLSWSCEGVDEAEKRILKTTNTLFDDVIKNLVNNPTFGTMVKGILLDGAHVPFEIRDPDIDLGLMFGIIKDNDGKACVSNIMFETVILNYYISTSKAKSQINHYVLENGSRFLEHGKLDMALVLQRFSSFLKSEYREQDGSFIEREGRLLFLSFLKPIINGIGHYVVEPETRGSRRMDIVIFYGSQKYIVELKIWHGERSASDAYDQLVGYLESQEQKTGFLLSFCDNRKGPREGRTFEHKGYSITEVIVAYRDTI